MWVGSYTHKNITSLAGAAPDEGYNTRVQVIVTPHQAHFLPPRRHLVAVAGNGFPHIILLLYIYIHTVGTLYNNIYISCRIVSFYTPPSDFRKSWYSPLYLLYILQIQLLVGTYLCNINIINNNVLCYICIHHSGICEVTIGYAEWISFPIDPKKLKYTICVLYNMPLYLLGN